MRLYVTLLMLLLVSGCNMVNNQSQTTAIATPVGKTWIVLSLSGNPVLNETVISLSIAEDGQVSGNTGANNFFGHWQLDESSIRSSKMGVTKRFRLEPKGVMKQEAQFLNLLSSVTAWKLSGGKLLLYQDNAITMVLKKSEK